MPRDGSNVRPLRPEAGISDEGFEALKQLVNHEAEQALLGALLINNAAYDRVCDKLSFEDFAHPLHGQIYAAIGSVIASGSVADTLTLHGFFAGGDVYLQSGGRSYLAQLAASAVTVINAPGYADAIADLARRRELVEISQELVNDAGVPMPDRLVSAVVEDIEQRLSEIAERNQTHQTARPMVAITRKVISDTEAVHAAGGAKFVNTGLLDLDHYLKGMAGGELIVLAGRPSMGKSALAGSIASNAADQGKRVGMFSLEMTGEELGQRWIAGRTGISTEKMRAGDLDMADWPRFRDAEAELGRLSIIVDDQARLSAASIRQRARRLQRRGGLDLVIIDHLQLIRQGGRQESRRTEIGDATSSLKAAAKELGVPVLLLSQISRKVEDRDDKRPMLSDLKESGDIEQDADVVLFLYREIYYLAKAEPRKNGRESKEGYASRLADWEADCAKVKDLAEIIVGKNRHGRTGFVKIHFDENRQRFSNLSKWEHPR